MTVSAARAQDAVRLFAAGSLRQALTEVAAAFDAAEGMKVEATFGASGLLRDRLAGGTPADVFASANMDHPQALAAAGLAGPVSLFARNRLCALSRAEVGVTSANLLDKLLDPSLKLGTSTPRADPAGDYAWALFRRAETVRPGSYAKLDEKALKLSGGPDSPPPPPDRNLYAMMLTDRRADIYLAYCTMGPLAIAENAEIRMIDLPANLAVAADYGLTVINGAPPGGIAFARFVLSPAGQSIIRKHGFDTPGGSP